jgi:peptidoglycan/LPS O-acetylase OafA/YrhL
MIKIDRIQPLTSLRFFAALSVVAWHLTTRHWISGKLAANFQLYDGVSFFYILSGFILQHAYGNVLPEIGGPRFVLLRIARIWPLHILIVLITLALAHHATIGQLVAVATLTQSWIPFQDYYFAVNGVAWSISDELFFYACFPLLTVLVRRNPKATLLVTCALLATYLRLVPSTGGEEQVIGLFGISPLVRMPEFILGMVVYELRSVLRKVPAVEKLPVLAWTALEIAVIAAVFAENHLIPAWGNAVWNFGQLGAVTWFYSVGTAPAFAVLILLFSLSNGPLARAISIAPMVLLGEISFSMYLLHQRIIFAFPPGGSLPLPGLILLILIVSYLAWRFVEKPATRFATSLISNRAVAAPAA